MLVTQSSTVSEMASTESPALATQAAPTADVNGTGVIWESCEEDIPSTEQLFRGMPKIGFLVLGFYVIFVCFTIGIYIEEILFLKAHFKDRDRRRRTIWLLTLFPVYSFTAFIGALIPRAATIVNLCASAFFGTCLFQLLELMVNYMGGLRRMWKIIGENKMIAPQTLPACCCCVCLPNYTFTRRRFFKLSVLVLQVAIIRPLLMFIACALWANGTYHPGKLSPWNAYLYITTFNLCCTFPAMYGLMQLRNGFLPELQPVKIAGKVAIIQIAMITTVAVNLIVGLLTHNGVVVCSSILPAPARGSVIYHGFIITIMVPYSIIGRLVYRRSFDGTFMAAAGQYREDLNYSVYDKGPNNNSQAECGGEEMLSIDNKPSKEEEA